MEEETNAILKKVENSEDYFEICGAFKGTEVDKYTYEGGKEEEDIKHQWQKFEVFNIGTKFENNFEKVKETERKKAWYHVVQKIQDIFKENFQS